MAKRMTSIDIEVIRTVFNFIFFHEKNSKHLKHKQKASDSHSTKYFYK